MRFGRLFLLAAMMLTSASAFAVDDDETDNHGKPKVRYELGARFHFLSINPILDNYYDEHESVNGYTVGPILSRRSEDGNTRLILGFDYSKTSPDDGPWLEAGVDPVEAEWTEFRNFSIITTNFMFAHVFRRGPFGFAMGGGLGIAYTTGTVTSYPTDASGGKLAGGEPDEKNIPKITPTVLIKVGPQFEMGRIGTVTLDVGLHNGLYAGASITTALPF
jgi:hypothetical protein